MKLTMIRPIIFIILISVGLTFIISKLLPSQYLQKYDIKGFRNLPVQEGGRVKPMDTLARNSLMRLQGKQTVQLPNELGGGHLDAITWLMDVSMRPEMANYYPVFRIDNPDVLGLFGWKQDRKYFSFNELAPEVDTIIDQAKKVNPEASLRTPFENEIDKLYHSLQHYTNLTRLLGSGSHPDDLELEYSTWLIAMKPGMEAIRNQEEGKTFDEHKMNQFIQLADRYLEISKKVPFGITPPQTNATIKNNDWSNVGQTLLNALVLGNINPILVKYGKLTFTYRNQDIKGFNCLIKEIQSLLQGHVSKKVKFETFFNKLEPFYLSIVFYLIGFLLICSSWLNDKLGFRHIGIYYLLGAFGLHTFGILSRIFIQGRPPVTNLYSSAIFVGWASVIIGLLMERVFKIGLGAAIASVIGFSTLIIAHNLGASGDTLEMVRAVLDSNFWLSTHVIVVTLGYAAMFFAGMLGILYVLGNHFRKSLSPETNQSLFSMAYGVVCFATLFSFVGTMLGGIWADQSWGRFWGWDPKENGALLIVLWCAVILHAKWAKLVSMQGFMVMTLFGNIVTSWSWFGTNMLGVGLHSYGFMNRAFILLVTFMLSQVIIMLIPFIWRKKDQA